MRTVFLERAAGTRGEVKGTEIHMAGSVPSSDFSGKNEVGAKFTKFVCLLTIQPLLIPMRTRRSRDRKERAQSSVHE